MGTNLTVSAIDVAASQAMYENWVGVKKDHDAMSPLECLKKVLGMDLEISTEEISTSANLMELIMLKLAEKALKGDMTAIQTIIKEVQHNGVEKHQYIDGIPDDIKYLYDGVEFTDITPEEVVEVSAQHIEKVEKKEQDIDELLKSWGQ